MLTAWYLWMCYRHDSWKCEPIAAALGLALFACGDWELVSKWIK